jgi:AraC-like DNA-binding protein
MANRDPTTTVTPEDGFDAWHQVTCRSFSLSQCRRESDKSFRAQVSSRTFGALALSRVSSQATNGFRMVRGHAEIRNDQRDHFMLFFVTGGQIDLDQDNRQASALPGDLLLYDQAFPFTLDFRGHQATLVNIPRALLVSRVPKVRHFTGRRISGTSALGKLAGTVVHQMTDFDDTTKDEVKDRLVTSALDILATTFEAELGDDTDLRTDRHRLLPRIERYILAHLHEPALDLEAIAHALGIAPRTLSRVFAVAGTTPIRWMWRQRLVASYKALSEGRTDSVTEAALSSGFTDLSHFSRAFKREFGQLPNVIQRSRSTQASPGTGSNATLSANPRGERTVD